MSNSDLIAQKGALKRVKYESRRVNTPATENRLKSALCANLKNACEALATAAFEVRNHPYLPGVRCRSDGAVFIPANGAHKAHWTHGCAMVSGYKEVVIQKRHYYAHRLVLEAFAGPCPEDKAEADHINRERSDNRIENLHWVSIAENRRNRASSDKNSLKYGVHVYEDKKAYDRIRHRTQYQTNPAFRAREIENIKACQKKRRRAIKEAKMMEEHDGR